MNIKYHFFKILILTLAFWSDIDVDQDPDSIFEIRLNLDLVFVMRFNSNQDLVWISRFRFHVKFIISCSIWIWFFHESWIQITLLQPWYKPRIYHSKLHNNINGKKDYKGNKTQINFKTKKWLKSIPLIGFDCPSAE